MHLAVCDEPDVLLAESGWVDGEPLDEGGFAEERRDEQEDVVGRFVRRERVGRGGAAGGGRFRPSLASCLVFAVAPLDFFAARAGERFRVGGHERDGDIEVLPFGEHLLLGRFVPRIAEFGPDGPNEQAVGERAERHRVHLGERQSHFAKEF